MKMLPALVWILVDHHQPVPGDRSVPLVSDAYAALQQGAHDE